ncbi:MAG: methylation-associated defense system helix-turn-helix domain-containing protein MAD1 [Thermodesulfobacteriota bacterium]
MCGLYQCSARLLAARQAERWLSVDEIAAYLGIKRDTVYKWISEKQMPAHRMGRLWKFRKEEVDEWVKSGGADDNEHGHANDVKKG